MSIIAWISQASVIHWWTMSILHVNLARSMAWCLYLWAWLYSGVVSLTGQRVFNWSCCLSLYCISFCWIWAKNIKNYSEYRVAHASGQLNKTSDAGNCGHFSSPPTSRNGNELSGDNILWSRLITRRPSERRQRERRQLQSKWQQREFIPSRLENVVKELVRSLWVSSVCLQCRIVF